MFKHTYSAQFYRQLHRYVHKNYRKQQALQTLKDLLKLQKKSNFGTLKRALSYIWYVPASMIEKQKLKQLHHE
jgi:anaerobic magnesium-protoporphyrin IX monomethyl ester cyclase